MSSRLRFACFLLAFASAPLLHAQSTAPSPRWELGYRGGTSLGQGEPANDLPIPASLFLRRQLDERWAIAAWLEHAAGDFETPAKVVGLVQDPSVADIDADLSTWTLGLAGERTLAFFEHEARLFAQFGAAVSMLDADDAQGPLAGGGTFDITTDPGSEFLATLGLGYRRPFARRWSFEALARYDHHFADWEVRDRLSGNTGSVDDYPSYALLLGLSYSF